MNRPNTICYLTNEHRHIELIVCRDSCKSYPLHNHVSVYTIGYILDGCLGLRTTAGTHTCQKDSCFLLEPYTPHAVTALQPYSMLCICIHKALLTQTDRSSLYAEIARLLRHADLPCNAQPEQILSIVKKIITNLSDHAAPPQSASKNIFLQLESYPEEKMSIDKMAAVTFTSKYQFIRNFKRDAGLTPHQFQLQNQIRKAQKVLSQTENITEAALISGFFDQSHFIRHFEKIVQLTPSEYKLCCRTVPDADI